MESNACPWPFMSSSHPAHTNSCVPFCYSYTCGLLVSPYHTTTYAVSNLSVNTPTAEPSYALLCLLIMPFPILSAESTSCINPIGSILTPSAEVHPAIILGDCVAE